MSGGTHTHDSGSSRVADTHTTHNSFSFPHSGGALTSFMLLLRVSVVAEPVEAQARQPREAPARRVRCNFSSESSVVQQPGRGLGLPRRRCNDGVQRHRATACSAARGKGHEVLPCRPWRGGHVERGTAAARMKAERSRRRRALRVPVRPTALVGTRCAERQLLRVRRSIIHLGWR